MIGRVALLEDRRALVVDAHWAGLSGSAMLGIFGVCGTALGPFRCRVNMPMTVDKAEDIEAKMARKGTKRQGESGDGCARTVGGGAEWRNGVTVVRRKGVVVWASSSLPSGLSTCKVNG